MRERPLVVNDRVACERCYDASLHWLTAEAQVHAQLARHMWAYHEAADLVPQTLDKLMSGHFFPYSESYDELESAYQLALFGFYRHALVALRSVLELGIIGVFFAVADNEHVEVQPWMRGIQRTPQLAAAVKRLADLRNFRELDGRCDIRARLLRLYEDLGGYAHVRGYHRSQAGLARSNVNTFSADALSLVTRRLVEVVDIVLTVMLLKYPLGLCPLPLDEKFGLDGPVGSFVQAHQVSLFREVLQPEVLELLQAFTDRDPDVQAAAAYFESLPDLTEDAFRMQVAEQDLLWGKPAGERPSAQDLRDGQPDKRRGG